MKKARADLLGEFDQLRERLDRLIVARLHDLELAPKAEISSQLTWLAAVVWAYQNEVVASRLHPTFPDKPGVDSALAYSMAREFKLGDDGKLKLPSNCDPVLAGRQRLKRLRRVWRSSSHAGNPGEHELFAFLISQLPTAPGRPKKKR